MSIPVALYGLKKCSTCQKAFVALKDAGYDVVLHDVRETPLSADLLYAWQEIFAEKLANRASLTWRNLSDSEKLQAIVPLIREYPSLMKRPLIVHGDQIFLGWTKSTKDSLKIL